MRRILVENSAVVRCPRLQVGDRVSLVDLGTDGEGGAESQGSRRREVVYALKAEGLRPRLDLATRTDEKNRAYEAIERGFLDPEVRAVFVIGEMPKGAPDPQALNYAALAAHPTILVTELASSSVAMSVHLHTNIVTFCWLPPELANSKAKGAAKPSHLDLLMRAAPVGRLKPKRRRQMERNQGREKWQWHNARIGEGRLLVGGIESMGLLSEESELRVSAKYLFMDPGKPSIGRVGESAESAGASDIEMATNQNRASVIKLVDDKVMRSLRGMILAERMEADVTAGERNEGVEYTSKIFARSVDEGRFPIATGASIRNGPGGSILPIGVRAQMNGTTRKLSIVEPGVH